MIQREFGNIGIKLLGIVAFLYALGYFPSLVAAFQEDGKNMPLLVAANILGVFLYMAAGKYLFSRSEYLSRRLFTAEADSGMQITSETLQPVMFSGIGIFILCQAIPKVMEIFFRFFLARRREVDEFTRAMIAREFAGQNWAAVLGLVIQILLGLVLFLGSSGLSKLWHRLRPLAKEGGIAAPSSEDEKIP